MKKTLLLAFAAFTLLFSSCTFTEHIYINDDGSGKMDFNMDGSEMMASLSAMGEGMNEEGKDDDVKEEAKEVVDTTFTFDSFLEEKRDSILKLPKAQQKKLEALRGASARMLMDEDKGVFTMDMKKEFKNIEEFTNFYNAIGEVDDNSMSPMGGGDEAKSKDNPFSGMMGMNQTTFSFDKKTFERTASLDMSAMTEEQKTQMSQSMQQMKMFFGGAKYKMVYHFSKPVKTISNEEALFSGDRKTVTIEYNFMEYLEDPEKVNLKVTF